MEQKAHKRAREIENRMIELKHSIKCLKNAFNKKINVHIPNGLKVLISDNTSATLYTYVLAECERELIFLTKEMEEL